MKSPQGQIGIKRDIQKDSLPDLSGSVAEVLECFMALIHRTYPEKQDMAVDRAAREFTETWLRLAMDVAIRTH